MLFRPAQTRRVSPDGISVETFLRGRVYDRPEEFVRRLFPDGTYEVVEVEVKANRGAPSNKALAGAVADKSVGGAVDEDALASAPAPHGADADGTGTPAPPTAPPTNATAKGRRRWLRKHGGS